ncbi:MAG: DNA polymerase III subunit alpha [bacterium]|nr:MAG: DNA polymerase III subunit alpha [bacterium]
MSFVHLWVHSNFSLLAGTRPVEDLVGAAAEAGMSALALTDTDGLYAVVPFQRACERAGIRPIYGVTLTGSWGEGRARVVLLARNAGGYRELCQLVTSRHLDTRFSLEEALSTVSDDLYLLSADVRVIRRLAGRRNLRVALPVSPGRQWHERRWRLRHLASRLGLGSVAAGEIYFIDRCEHYVHMVLTAIRTRTTVGTLPPGEAAPPTAFFRSPKDVMGVFGDDPDALDGTAAVAADCCVELDLRSRKLPHFRLPPGDDPAAVLRRLAVRGLGERLGRRRDRGHRYGTGNGCGVGERLGAAEWRTARERLEEELAVVITKGLAGYFLICWDIVRFARSRGMRSLGRGSAGNSLVSYALGITHVNPLRHNLFFQRFLNPERERLPDFDIDFATDDREEVLAYIFRRYGRRHVAMIGTYSTFRARAALRETAKTLGIPESEVGPLVKRIPFFASVERLREVCAVSPAADIPLDREPFATLLPLAVRIGGSPRHMATHPCGLVISPGPITDTVPLQRGDKGYEITQWSMHEIEDAGFVKIDVIGQKGLAVIQEAAAMAEENEGRPLHPERIDYCRDPATRRMLREGHTEGCFYIESPGMVQLIRQARCDDFEVLTALSSIIRPGVSSYGGKRQYLRRHLGLEPVTVIHPALEEVLSDTCGCLIYQEQVIRIAVAVAGMSYAQADGLRRCMSYKNQDAETMASYRDAFMRGALARGIPDGTAREIFRQIASFAGYAFCKAHSASFALESFESVYWKTHYPAEFMAAVLSNGGGYYSQEEYLEEARRMGLAILPPCVNVSRLRHHGAGDALRIGLMQIKGLTVETAERIVEERPYRSLGGFLARVPASRDEVESLIRCGAMDSFGRSRPELLWELHLLRPRGKTEGKGEAGAPEQVDVGGRCVRDGARTARRTGGHELIDRLPRIPDHDLPQRVSLEREYLGLAVSAHPLAMFEREISQLARSKEPARLNEPTRSRGPARPRGLTLSGGSTPSGRPTRSRGPTRPGGFVRSVDLADRVGEEVELVGWKVTVKPTRTVTQGEEMIFVTFSDRWGRFEAIFFPRVYARTARELVRGRGPFLVRGRVESELGVESLIAEEARLVTRLPGFP